MSCVNPLATTELGYDTGDSFQFYALAEENKDCTRCLKFSLIWLNHRLRQSWDSGVVTETFVLNLSESHFPILRQGIT